MGCYGRLWVVVAGCDWLCQVAVTRCRFLYGSLRVHGLLLVVGCCDWLWPIVGRCGWLWLVVAGC